MKRLLAVLLVLSLLATAVCFLASCGTETYLTVGGEKVSYDMVRCTVRQYMSVYTAEQLQDEEIRQKIRDTVYEDLRLRYVVYTVADEHGVRLTAEQKSKVKEQLKVYRALEDYDEMLETMFATDKIMETLLYIDALDTALYDTLEVNGTLKSDNDTIDADLEGGRWYAAEYAILQYDDTNRETRKAQLENAIATMGTSFKAAMKSVGDLYTADYYYSTDGCFTDTIYSEDFETTVKELEIGEVSGVIDSVTASGYACFLVMKRVAVEDSYVDENYNTVIAYYLAREYAEMMTERAAELEIVIMDKYKDTDILDIR